MHKSVLNAKIQFEVLQEGKERCQRDFTLHGKPWESKQTECKVNTFIDRLCMWSASDQPQQRLSARGLDGRAHLKSFENTKRTEADVLKSELKMTNMLPQELRIEYTLFYFL